MCIACRRNYDRFSIQSRLESLEPVAGPSRGRQPAEEETGFSDETEIISGISSVSISQASASPSPDGSSSGNSSSSEDEQDEESGDEDFENLQIDSESENPITKVTISSHAMCVFKCNPPSTSLFKVDSRV